MKNTKRTIRENGQREGWDDWGGEITDWNDKRYADDADWGRNNVQTIDSHKTSMVQLPSSVLKMRDHNDWKKGNTNFNMGGGKTDNVQAWLNGKTKGVKGIRPSQQNDVDYGVIDLVFDPFSRDDDYNKKTIERVEELGGADTVTCNNVLNVIDSKQEILNVIQRCAEVLKQDGVAYFITYENGGNGIGVPTTAGYQQSKKTIKYTPLIHKFFNRVKLSDNMIIAKDPIKQENSADWFTNAEDSLSQTNPRKINLKKESIMKRNVLRLNENQFKSLIKESVVRALNEINDIHNGRTSNDENCPYLNKVFGHGFTLRKMLSYDDMQDRIEYAEDHLEEIGMGKRRTTFVLDDNLILKLSNGSHTFQTQNEYNFAFNRSGDMDLMPRIIYQSQDFTWTIMERAMPLEEGDCEKLLGMPLYDNGDGKPSLEGFQMWAETVSRQPSRQSRNKVDMVNRNGNENVYRNLVSTNPWFRKLFKLEQSQRGDLNFGTDINPSGYDFRSENLGIVNRNGKPTIVLLDGGFLAPWGDVRKLGAKAEKVRNRR